MGRIGEKHQATTGLGDGSDHLISGEHPAERRVAPGQALAAHHDVGHDVPVVDAELPTGTPKAGHDLIGDQQDPVIITDRPNARPPVIGRDQCACRGPDDRLGDHRGDRLRPLGLDHPDQTLGVEVRHPGMVNEHLFEPGPAGPVAADGEGGEGHPVVGSLSTDDLAAFRLSDRREVGDGQPDGRID